jgi:tetratricopeptide (TPR) repeat protein
MKTRRSLWRVAIIALLIVPVVGCSLFDELSAIRTFKDANTFYGRGDFEAAVEEYGKVLEILDANPDGNELLTAAYFYIANSHDQLYSPARRGEPDNQRNLEEAIHYYELASERIPDPDLRKLSMQYLVAAFGADKANDPAGAEPVLREMIQIDPVNPDNYFALARLYEDAGLFEDAESVMLEVRNIREDDPIVYLQLAGFYNRAGDFEQTIDALEQRAAIEPDNPEAYYTISTYYWEKSFRDFRITQDQKRDYILAGLEASDRALDLNERYVDALVYKNILLRMQANMTEDLDEQKELIGQADELRDLAQRLQKEAEGQPAADAADGAG